MKKLMLAIGAVAVAACVQAASVNWSVGNVRIPVAADPTVSQSGITVSTANSTFSAGALTIYLSYMAGSTETAITSSANTAAGALAYGAIWDATAASAAVTANGNNPTITFIIKATYETADGKYEYLGQNAWDITNAASDTKNVSLGFNMANHGSWNYTANPVPEPTSGLLMLLGIAGLALKRKRA